ncbi:MAG: radical SAM protein [Armatimonadetes bacterium]|nr:radical SAM protein [Armatimonadota bacterium]
MRAWDLAKRYAANALVAQVARFVARRDKEGIIGLVRVMERLAPYEYQRRRLEWMRQLFEQDHPATRLALRVARELHPKVRAKLIQNLFVNNAWLGSRRRAEVERNEGIHVPYLFVISPTMRCNLRCYGCYAGAYRQEDDLPFDLWDSILQQAKDLGIFFVTISGGEPFVRADELLDLAWKHNDMVFQVYTNGTLIDERMAQRLRDVGNVSPAISVEGFTEQTDERRGPGVHRKVLRAMAALREAGCLYGFSATVTRHNAEVLASDDFIDFYVEQGCYFGWFFNYIPIGRGPDLDLMPTPEQRNMMRLQAMKIRRTRPIFVADFWNDGALTGGCMAGGRMYFHVNHRGEVEPCVFAHFAVDNLHDKTLKEALASEFFRAIQRRQPYHENLLRPCMIIDHPHILREIVAETGARATDVGGEKLLTEKAAGLDDYARRWAEIADRAWEQEDYSWAKRGGLMDAEEAVRQQEAAQMQMAK